MIYSKTTEYAIRALTYMALKPDGACVGAREISREAAVPYAYIAKTFQVLVSSGILQSRKGPSGGFLFARKPSKIYLIDVMNALDDSKQSPLSKCVMGLERCGDANPCPLHFIWLATTKKITEKLKDNTLLDMTAFISKFPAGPVRRKVLSRRMRNIFGQSAN